MRLERKNFFPNGRAAALATLAVATLIAAAPAFAQNVSIAGGQTPSTPATATAPGAPVQSSTGVTLSKTKGKDKKPKVAKEDRVKQTKDTKAEIKRENKYNPLIEKDTQLPDKQLYDKALAQVKSGHYDVARLDLQTLLNTYPDSQYQMRSKLAIADSWYREGGSAALAQAEQEYRDFITFFPNSPEAAEAQMRVGDIFFKQMDVPDRDFSKAVHAQDEYRTMLKQYPDAPPTVTAEARQKLREVQEVLATREAELASFYGGHENFPAAIARYQTVVDNYPQYSHMDDTLIGVGDAYEAQARNIRSQPTCPKEGNSAVPCLPEGPKAKLEQDYDGRAAAAYRKVVLEHSAAPHVEDAKERLVGMNLPVPTPTPEQIEASEKLEGSRAQYNLRKRLELLILHKPDVVTAAQAGDPPLEDKPITTAPMIVSQITEDYKVAFGAAPTTAEAKPAAGADQPAAPSNSATPAPAAPLAFSDVPAAGQGARDASTGTLTPTAPEGSSGNRSGASLGVEILTPSARGGSGIDPNRPPLDTPAARGEADPTFGLRAVKPKDNSPLPAAEKPEEAPDAINDVAGKPQPAGQVKPAGQKKNPKPEFDKNDESSSKHKKKKGVNKINPF